MKDIIVGGEFKIPLQYSIDQWLGCDHDRLFSCGRTALQFILERIFDEKHGVVLIPDHICGSVPETVRSTGKECRFYHINDDFKPEINGLKPLICEADAIIIVNYFGMISEDNINYIMDDIKKVNKDIVIILDDVQNFYGIRNENICDYAFTSLRKWFPVPDGAIVICNKNGESVELYPKIRDDSSVNLVFSQYKYAGNVLKNFREIIGDEICLELIDKGEELLAQGKQEYAMGWTTGVMEELDLEAIKKKRKENAHILHEGLKRLNIRHLYEENATPLFVPILVNNRDRIRKRMYERSVFCPIHWEEKWKKDYINVEKNHLYDIELSLICDQRYSKEEMEIQLEILRDECFDH